MYLRCRHCYVREEYVGTLFEKYSRYGMSLLLDKIDLSRWKISNQRIESSARSYPSEKQELTKRKSRRHSHF